MPGKAPMCGDKLEVVTRSLCRYEGLLLGVSAQKATFTLKDVHAFGTEDRYTKDYHAPSARIYDCVEFKANDVTSLHVIDAQCLQDPAIVNIQGSKNEKNFEAIEHQESTEGGNLRPRYGFSRGFNTRARPQLPHFVTRSNPAAGFGGGGGYLMHNRSNWRGINPRSEGRFAQTHPGVQNHTLEDFDFDQGIEEFTRLRLNTSMDETEATEQSPHISPDKTAKSEQVVVYNKEKSFFDNLSGTSDFAKDAARRSSGQRRNFNPNVETFGEETVKQLSEIRRFPPSDQRPHHYRGSADVENFFRGDENRPSYHQRNLDAGAPFRSEFTSRGAFIGHGNRYSYRANSYRGNRH